MAKQQESGISWAHYTFNPWWGCEKISPACAACYAEAWSNRCGLDLFGPGKPAHTFGARHWGQVHLWDSRAERMKTRFRVFCGSMCDIFQKRDDVKLEREQLWFTVETTPHLDWMFLTKRPENAEELIPEHWRPKWPKNVWMGVTAENQEMADKRIPVMLKLNSQFFFVSCEPLLSDMSIRKWLPAEYWCYCGYVGDETGTDYCVKCGAVFGDGDTCQVCGNEEYDSACPECDTVDGFADWTTGPLDQRPNTIGWVIVGGESRLKDRPMDPRYVRGIHQQCIDAGIPFHFKQWGQWGTQESIRNHEVRNTGTDIIQLGEDRMYLVGKKRAGRILDGKEWLEVPEVA